LNTPFLKVFNQELLGMNADSFKRLSEQFEKLTENGLELKGQELSNGDLLSHKTQEL